MKIKPILLIIFLLAAGVYTADFILKTAPSNTQKSDNLEPSGNNTDSIPKGSHGGWLFSEKDLKIEVKIFEKGVPPEFRVYITDKQNKPVSLNEVKLTIKLNRLDRVDTIRFKPMGKYLLGNKTVVEPHSFDVDIQAQWQGQKFEWKFSQIEARVELSEAALKNAGITIKKAGSARLTRQIHLPGEIGLNEGKVVHIVPRLDGVVKKTFKHLGDDVVPGDILAIIESRELADAKINYLSKIQQIGLVKSDLERESLLLNSTHQLLDLLQKEKDLEEVYRELEDLQIGKSRELLIPAYAKMKLAKSVYLREKNLFQKGISSESEYLQAAENYKIGGA
ncbi:MAG: efflux RND transporter periplasmic adaptor subunit [Nitrospinae bacterium]|nr:efflux RND transporter periplasmic adaptor subunit [Nitrospinota bacterium]